MKKRYAALAAISLGLFQAVSLIGAVPASAALPVVAADKCELANGVLFAFGDTDTGDGNVKLSVNNDADTLYCTVDGVVLGPGTPPSINPYDIEDIDEIVVAAEGILIFELEDYAATGEDDDDRLADFPDVDYSIAAHDVLFDAGTSFLSGDTTKVEDARDDVEVTVSDEEFDINGVGGDVDYNTGWWFYGGAGEDSFDASETTIDVEFADGGDNDDVLSGGEGDDRLVGSYGDDKLFGNDGDDDLDCREKAYEDSSPGKNLVTEADQCWGGDGDDDISANALGSSSGSDSYKGYDTVAPGDGDDDLDDAYVLYYGDSSEAVVVSVDDGEVSSDAGDDVFHMVDNFVGSPDDDTFYGSSDPDSFTGGGGDDTLYGYGEDDTLNGGGGEDTIIGDGGTDTIKGNGGDDLIKAGSRADSVNGGAGDDVMYGMRGDDTLLGKAGSDQAWGGTGKDLCIAEVKDSCEFSKI